MSGKRAATKWAVGLVAALALALQLPAAVQAQISASPTGDRRAEHCLTAYSIDQAASGECRMRGRADVSLSALSPFGKLPFAFCEMSFVLHFEVTGGVAIDQIVTDGPFPCGDVRPCRDLWNPESRPWTGRIEAQPRSGLALILHDACFDTCIGWFEGELRLQLDRVEGRWRIRAESAPVGDSGLELRGDWWLDGRDVRIERQ